MNQGEGQYLDVTDDDRNDSHSIPSQLHPGEFRGDGHVYGFFTDQHLLDDLSALNMHAARSLIECMSDGRKSKVRYDDRDTREPRRALRGALCFEALVHTYFYQMRDDSLFRRALLASDCDEHADEGPKY